MIMPAGHAVRFEPCDRFVAGSETEPCFDCGWLLEDHEDASNGCAYGHPGCSAKKHPWVL